MQSIIIELQEEIIGKSSNVSDLLRKGLVISQKLKLNDLQKWVKSELYGYRDNQKLPEYRFVYGEIEAFDYKQGRWKPIHFENPRQEERISRAPIHYPVIEIEKIIEDKDNIVVIALDTNVERGLMKSLDITSKPSLIVLKSNLITIIDNIKTILLEWSLNLEKKGIIGNGLSFTTQEIIKAKTVYITNFNDKVINSQINTNSSNSNQNN